MLHLDNAVSCVASLIRSLILSVYTTIITLNILEIYIKAPQGLLNYCAVVIFSYVYNLKQVHFFYLVCSGAVHGL